MLGQACSKLIQWTCLFHSCLPTPKKWKSHANLFKNNWGSKNAQICLAYSMPRAGMLQTNIFCIFFFTLMSIYEQKVKVRHQSVQEMLWIKEYSNVIGWDPLRSQGKAYSKLIHPACSFINGYPDAKNPSQTPIHSWDVEDEKIPKSDWLRSF